MRPTTLLSLSFLETPHDEIDIRRERRTRHRAVNDAERWDHGPFTSIPDPFMHEHPRTIKTETIQDSNVDGAAIPGVDHTIPLDQFRGPNFHVYSSGATSSRKRSFDQMNANTSGIPQDNPKRVGHRREKNLWCAKPNCQKIGVLQKSMMKHMMEHGEQNMDLPRYWLVDGDWNSIDSFPERISTLIWKQNQGLTKDEFKQEKRMALEQAAAEEAVTQYRNRTQPVIATDHQHGRVQEDGSSPKHIPFTQPGEQNIHSSDQSLQNFAAPGLNAQIPYSAQGLTPQDLQQTQTATGSHALPFYNIDGYPMAMTHEQYQGSLSPSQQYFS